MTHTLTPEQIAQTADLITILQKAVEVPPPPPPPAFNNGVLQLRAYDVYVPPGERMAYVPVELNEDPKQTVVFKCLTQNDTAVENNHFVRVEKYIVFQPGEKLKLVAIPLKKDLGTTKFKLTIGWPQNISAIQVADSTALICGLSSDATNKYVGPAIEDGNALISRPANMSLVFKEDFTNFQATDSGFLADGVTPCWRTRYGHGREQPDNKELGYYADATLNPGTTPYYKDANGRLVLQSEYFPDGVKDIMGNNIICAWDNNQPYKFTSTIITTQRNFNNITRGDYIEARMTMPMQEGAWPALWTLITEYWEWPGIELDVFEGFFANPGSLAQVGTTVHWKNAGGGHSMFSVRLPQLGIDLTQPHTWGMYWGDKEVTFFCDDVAYFAVPNVFPDRNTFLLLDITTGGLVGLNPDPAINWPARMYIDWVKIWR